MGFLNWSLLRAALIHAEKDLKNKEKQAETRLKTEKWRQSLSDSEREKFARNLSVLMRHSSFLYEKQENNCDEMSEELYQDYLYSKKPTNY